MDPLVLRLDVGDEALIVRADGTAELHSVAGASSTLAYLVYALGRDDVLKDFLTGPGLPLAGTQNKTEGANPGEGSSSSGSRRAEEAGLVGHRGLPPAQREEKRETP